MYSIATTTLYQPGNDLRSMWGVVVYKSTKTVDWKVEDINISFTSCLLVLINIMEWIESHDMCSVFPSVRLLSSSYIEDLKRYFGLFGYFDMTCGATRTWLRLYRYHNNLSNMQGVASCVSVMYTV